MTVRNAGDRPAADFTVALYDGDPDAGGVPIAPPRTITDLPGGASQTISETWVLPTDGLAHQVFAVVDDSSNVPETNEGNNRAGRDVLGPALGLSLAGIHYDSANQVTLVVEAENTGHAPLTGAKVDFHRDSADGALLGQQPLGRLNPGQTQQVGQVWNVTGLAAGSYDVAAVGQPGDATTEFTALLLPDLAIAAEDITFSAGSNQTYAIQLTVHNQGLRPASNVAVGLFAGSALRAAASPAGAGHAGQHPGRGQATVELPWSVPAGGDLYVAVDPMAKSPSRIAATTSPAARPAHCRRPPA